MSGRRNKIETNMDACIIVGDQISFNFQLLFQICLELLIDIIHNYLGTKISFNIVLVNLKPLFFVKLITKSGSFDHTKFDMHAPFGYFLKQCKFH